MKIGILTLHEADNYGAVLQAYALQQILMQMQVESSFLTFNKEEAEKKVASLPSAIARLQAYGNKRKAHFSQFRERYLKCDVPIALKDAASLNEQYDCFIVGSDQVWNPYIPEVDERYFLPFAEAKKRYSYAASFGTKALPDKLRSWCAGELSRFAGLSVREESGKTLLAELTGREAQVHLDPTLLLSKEEWLKLTIQKQEQKPYVFLFLLNQDNALYQQAKEQADSMNMELKIVTASFLPQFGLASWSETGVEDWLSLIANAQCVYTNSFHGTVFSMMFDRPVRTAKLTGVLENRNGRLEQLLGQLSMEICFSEPAAIGSARFEKEIQDQKKQSLAYIERILKE